MHGPSDDLRAEIANRMDEVADEAGLDDVLAVVIARLEDDLASDEESPGDTVAAVQAWASVASYCVGRHYAPASPWKPGLPAGWDKTIVKKLGDLASKVRGPLEGAARASGANSISVGLAFPWGVSVEIGWSW